MMSDPHEVSRRDFIKGTAAVIGRLIGVVIGIPARFDFTQTKVNGWERTATNYGLYVVRKNESEVRVFSDICTHLGRRVSWHADQEHYISPVMTGTLTSSSADLHLPPLDAFVAKIEGGELFVQLPLLSENHNHRSRKQ